MNPTKEGGSSPARPLEIIPTKEANAILERGHYLGPLGYEPYFCIATPERDALAVFSPPVPWQFRAALHYPLDLSRLWRADNFTYLSPFLARVLRMVPRVARDKLMDSDCVFSYADAAEGHVGTIYQATNWRYLGPSRVIDTWFDEAGNEVPLTQCYRQMKTKSHDKIKEQRPNWRFQKGVAKHLYLYGLQKTPDDIVRLLAASGSRYEKFFKYPESNT